MKCFLLYMIIVFSLVFYQRVIKVIWVSSLCQCCGLCLVLEWDDCGMFPKIGYFVSVEGNVVHVCEVSISKWS